MILARSLVRHYNSVSSDLVAKATVGGLVVLSGVTQTVLRISMTVFFIYASSLVYHMDQELKQNPRPSQVVNVSELKQIIQELK